MPKAENNLRRGLSGNLHQLYLANGDIVSRQRRGTPPARPVFQASRPLRRMSRRMDPRGVQRGESRALVNSIATCQMSTIAANIPEIGISAKTERAHGVKGLHLDRCKALAGSSASSHFAKGEASGTLSTTTIVRALQSGHRSAGWPSSTLFDTGRINIE